MSEEKPIIAERIKILRKEKGYTQEQLAELLGLNAKSSIANYESGANAPSDEIKAKMCELFNCTMDYLMGNSEYKSNDEIIELYLKNQYEIDVTNAILSTDILFINSAIDVSYRKKIMEILLNNDTFNNKQHKLDDLINSFTGKQKKQFAEIVETVLEYISSQEEARNTYQYIINLKNNENSSNNKLFNIPILGKIAAGQPILADEYLEGYLPVDPNIYGMTTPDDYFYLKVSGESMNLKVHNGDYALIHKQDYAENGDIIVAIVNGDDEATMKRYKKINNEIVMLEPMSTLPMEPIVINLKETKFQIIGKAIGQFGKF